MLALPVSSFTISVRNHIRNVVHVLNINEVSRLNVGVSTINLNMSHHTWA